MGFILGVSLVDVHFLGGVVVVASWTEVSLFGLFGAPHREA